jgi:4-methylaminobutanoate oxidase (formaldehyde-forming)
MTELPAKARAVIVGGGVVGCSIAYHLAKLGWRDVVLLERKRLTSGTTWHAAGLIGQLRATKNLTRLAKYTADLYSELEGETGLSTGFRRCGSISVALTEARREELFRTAAMARSFGVDVEELDQQAVSERYPHLNIEGVTAGVFLPGDGQGDPSNITLALAKGARQRGAELFEGVKVTGFRRHCGRVAGVDWIAETGESGHITCEAVVIAAGMWSREVGLMAGARIPLHACEHFYVVSEPIDGLGALPVLRVPDECTYYKEDAGKMMLGAFEPVAKPWGMDGIPETFEFDQLPEDVDHFAPILEAACRRMPMLAEAGIQTFFNGPESFTPDDAYHLGLAPGTENVWVAAGFNSIGIQSAGGAGMALAQWMEDGEKPFDLGEVDIARMQPFQNTRTYLFERSKETLGLLYADHFPHRQKATARGIRRSPLHDALIARGAVMGEAAGWERANWFARGGQAAEYEYGWGRQAWFGNMRDEHMALRQGAGLYDMSSFGKLRIEGPDAERFLNRVCGARLDVPVGRIVYTQMLNPAGGIEADVTVARLSETAYLMVTPAATRLADQTWLERHRGEDRAVVVDVTAAEAVLALMGPAAASVLSRVSPEIREAPDQPFGTWREIELGMAPVRAHRTSYVGEYGWELFVSSEMAGHVFETLISEGGADLTLCGLHAVDSCRMEKAFRHFGHDITSGDHVIDAGLGFAVKTDKPDFIGRDAVLRRLETGPLARLLQFRLADPAPLLFHNEPILRDGKIVGHLCSGAYGHALGTAIGLGYVPCAGQDAATVLGSSYEIDVTGTRIPAAASHRPLYDPEGKRMRGI